MQGEAAEVRRGDERGAILAALEDATEPMTPKDIEIATGMNRNNCDQLLHKMGKAGEVVKAKRGRYVHPKRNDLIDAGTSTPSKNDKKIRNDDEEDGDD